jgi:hypothetical protein
MVWAGCLPTAVVTAAAPDRVRLQTCNSDPRTITMTDDKIAVQELLEKGSDTMFLREMIGFAAVRLMALEVEHLRGAASASEHPTGAGTE